MHMKIILKQDVANIGKEGGLYEVSPGYFRNFLQPRGLAVGATTGGVSAQKVRVARASTKEAREQEEARKLAGSLGEMSLTFPVKVGEQGRMHGSITAREVAEALHEAHGLEIDRHKIDLGEGLRSPGEHTATIKLDHGVEAELKIELVPEEAAAE